jgi:UDP-4-amino-4,6-dideoxy-N-acetyl-beta-L-altrosamine transaminase
MIPYGRQDITQEDIDEVVRVLRSDFLTQGPQIELFESALATAARSRFAKSFSNATAALHSVYLALGVKPGDTVWTSPITFVATSNAAIYCGAEVDFVDVEPDTGNMSMDALEEKLIEAKKAGNLPKLVVPVHLSGYSCDMRRLKGLADSYQFQIVEDASHAIGGKYQGEPIGSCQFSDAAVFSFHPVKIITTAEGGAVTTNNPEVDRLLSLFRSHGITRDPQSMEGESHGPWYYQQIELGFNYRMTDIQAALGSSQLKRLDAIVSSRQDIAKRYNDELSSLPLSTPHVRAGDLSAFHLYIIRLDREPFVGRRREVFESLRSNGIGVNVHYIPVHTQPFYQKRGFRSEGLQTATAFYSSAISLPMFPTLRPEQQEHVVSTLKRILG